MTGFARTSGTIEDNPYVLEAKSVNGRSLELRFRLPHGLDGLEAKMRTIAADRLKRGNIQISLQFSAAGAKSQTLRVNWAAVDELAHIFDRLGVRLGASPPSLDGVLQIRGILETGEVVETDEQHAQRESVLLASFRSLIGLLDENRRSEGARLHTVLVRQLDEIESLVRIAAARVADLGETIRARLKTQIATALELAPALTEDRLAQEVALLLVKADVGEELARLDAHVSAVRELLGSAEPQGRRLEFMAQEFHREANTLCSKSTDLELTRTGIDLKSVIDQFREQVQNIE